MSPRAAQGRENGASNYRILSTILPLNVEFSLRHSLPISLRHSLRHSNSRSDTRAGEGQLTNQLAPPSVFPPKKGRSNPPQICDQSYFFRKHNL